jgi:hypothetical protein
VDIVNIQLDIVNVFSGEIGMTEDQRTAEQKAVAYITSSLEEAEIQQMPVATLRAIKQGRPFKVKPTGITAKGFSGFKFNESMQIFAGRKVLGTGFPKKPVQRFVEGFHKSVAECEGGYHDAIELCLTRDGELLQFNGLRSMPQSPEARALMTSECSHFCFLELRLLFDELLERRMAFLERRQYREPDSIRETRERRQKRVISIKELLSDHNPRFYLPLLEKIFGREVTLEEFQWVWHENNLYRFRHKPTDRFFGFDHDGNYYRYENGEYIPAAFDLEDLQHAEK